MRGYELVKVLNFVRMGGSEEELRAAEIIKAEVKGSLEEFMIPYSEIKDVNLVVNNEKYEATGFLRSGNIDGEYPLVVVDMPEACEYLDLENKACLIPCRLTYAFYNALVKAKAACVITSGGSIYDDISKTDLEEIIIRDRHLKEGTLCGFNIRTIDALKIAESNATTVSLKLIQEETTRLSHNVVSVIPGEKEEEIVFTAHYDSVKFSQGIYDNGTGSGAILDLYNYFKHTKPKYTLRFIWCGSEERGLLGSKAYTEFHKDELKKMKLCINVDMTGVVLGYDLACISAGLDIVNYVKALSCEVGFPIKVSQGVYSSDSTPFADNGVPSISFARLGYENGNKIHSRLDDGRFLNENNYNNTLNFIITFVNKILEAKVYPLSKDVPENIKNDIQKYYGLNQEKKS